jgi:hypothetical protein
MTASPWSITITPVPGSEDCIVETSTGEKWTVKGLALFADGGDGNLFFYWWNSPAQAACGCVRAFAEAIRREDPFALAFYKKVLQGMVAITGCKDRQTISAEDLLRRWDAEDVYKAAQEPKNKFN